MSVPDSRRSRGHDFRPAKTCRVARRNDSVPLRGIDLPGPDLAWQCAGANRRGPLKSEPGPTSYLSRMPNGGIGLRIGFSGARARRNSLPQLPGADETGADPLAAAPDQRTYPKHLATGGKRKTEQLRHRQIADLQADAVVGDIDDLARDPRRIRRRNQKSLRVQIDPDALARAAFYALFRHRSPCSTSLR